MPHNESAICRWLSVDLIGDNRDKRRSDYFGKFYLVNLLRWSGPDRREGSSWLLAVCNRIGQTSNPPFGSRIDSRRSNRKNSHSLTNASQNAALIGEFCSNKTEQTLLFQLYSYVQTLHHQLTWSAEAYCRHYQIYTGGERKDENARDVLL